MAALDLTPAEAAELRHHLERVTEALAAEFADTLPVDAIQRYVEESYDEIRKRARVADFIPVFVERHTRERLHALAQADGRRPKERPEVLFVCVHNAGRSQIGAALTVHLSGGAVNVHSAGSDPAETINPAVVAILGERGIDLSSEFPKPLRDEVVRAADVVITMGCGDACPIYPGKRYLDWAIDDPAGQPREVVERIVAEIEGRVRQLLAELGIPAVDA